MRQRVALLLACVAGLSACASQTVLVDAPPNESHPSTQTFDQHGIHFEYPGAWLTLAAPATPGPSPSSGQPATVQPQQQSIDIVGLDELNRVTVVYGLSGLSSEDFATWSEQAKLSLANRVASHQATLVMEPEEIRTAGARALHYQIRVPSGLGYNVDVTWVGFLRGSTQFVITCSSIPERAAEVQRGCQQILATLQVS